MCITENATRIMVEHVLEFCKRTTMTQGDRLKQEKEEKNNQTTLKNAYCKKKEKKERKKERTSNVHTFPCEYTMYLDFLLYLSRMRFGVGKKIYVCNDQHRRTIEHQ